MTAIERTTIYVKPGFSQWSVREETCEKPVAYFTSRDEAVKYASAFAKTKPAAVLQVLDERGDILIERTFSMNPDGSTRPLTHQEKTS